MSNPYQTPAFDSKQFQDHPGFGPGGLGAGWVRQVRTFAILNAVQGILEILLGLMMSVAGAIFPILGRMEEVKKAEDGPPPEQSLWIMGIVYLAIGLVVLACGILRIVAGVQNYRFKGRMLGLISIIVGVVPVFTCYCAPTAIGLLVFGLIIHLDAAVTAAFEMANQGKTA